VTKAADNTRLFRGVKSKTAYKSCKKDSWHRGTR